MVPSHTAGLIAAPPHTSLQVQPQQVPHAPALPWTPASSAPPLAGMYAAGQLPPALFPAQLQQPHLQQHLAGRPVAPPMPPLPPQPSSGLTLSLQPAHSSMLSAQQLPHSLRPAVASQPRQNLAQPLPQPPYTPAPSVGTPHISAGVNALPLLGNSAHAVHIQRILNDTDVLLKRWASMQAARPSAAINVPTSGVVRGGKVDSNLTKQAIMARIRAMESEIEEEENIQRKVHEDLSFLAGLADQQRQREAQALNARGTVVHN